MMTRRVGIAKTTALTILLGLVATSAAFGWWLSPVFNPETYLSKKLNGAKPMSTVEKPLRGIEHVNEATFDRHVLRSPVPVLVDFYADWCGPCQALAPVLAEVARETANAKVVKVNVDQAPELAARYGISSIPSVMVFRDGQVVAEHVGLASKNRLKAMLAL